MYHPLPFLVRKEVVFYVKMKRENKYVPNQDAPDSTSESKRIESQFNFGRVQLWHATGCVYYPDASSWLLKTSKTRWNACIFETRSSTFIKRSWTRLYDFRNAYRRIYGRNSEKSRPNASGWNTERTQTQLVCVSHLHGERWNLFWYGDWQYSSHLQLIVFGRLPQVCSGTLSKCSF